MTTLPDRRGAGRADQDAGIARLVLINGPPASGKSTLARRYVEHHDGAALVEVDALRMSLPGWQDDQASRLAARDLAGAAVGEHLAAGRDVVMPQYFGRVGYISLLEDMAHARGATFVEVILSVDAALAVERFRTRRATLAARGERHPERDLADDEVEAFILDAVGRLERMSATRSASLVIAVDREDDEDEVYGRLCSVLVDGDRT